MAVHVMTGERFDRSRADPDQGLGRVVGQLEGPPRQAYRRRGVSAEPGDEPGLREEQPGALHAACGVDPTDLLVGDGARPRDRTEVEEVDDQHVREPRPFGWGQSMSVDPSCRHQWFELGPAAGEEQVLDRHPGEVRAVVAEAFVATGEV
jgi:hypothetical protein